MAIYSSLMVAPIGAVFPMLFKKAAFMIYMEEEEERMLAQLQVIKLNKLIGSSGKWLLGIGYAVLSLWVTGAIFLCLIYGCV